MMLTKDFPMTGPQRQNHIVHIFFFRNNISILVYSPVPSCLYPSPNFNGFDYHRHNRSLANLKWAGRPLMVAESL